MTMLHPSTPQKSSRLVIIGIGLVACVLLVLISMTTIHPRLPDPKPFPYTTDRTTLLVPPGLFPQSDFTLVAWIQLTRAIPRKECIIMAKDALELVILDNGRLEFSVTVTLRRELTRYVFRGRRSLIRGEWHHIAAAYSNRGGAMLLIDGAGDHLPFEIEVNRIFGNPVPLPPEVFVGGSCADNGGFGGLIYGAAIELDALTAPAIRSAMFKDVSIPEILKLRDMWTDSLVSMYNIELFTPHDYKPLIPSTDKERKPLVVIVPVIDSIAASIPTQWPRGCHKPHEFDHNLDLVYWHASKNTLKSAPNKNILCFKNVYHIVSQSLPSLPTNVPWHRSDSECWLFYSMFESEFLVYNYRYAFLIDSTVRPVRTGWLERVMEEITFAQPFEDFWVKGSVNPHADPEHSFVQAPPALYALGNVELNVVLKVVYDRFKLSHIHGGGGRCGGCHCGEYGGAHVCMRKYLMSEEAFATAQSSLHMWRYHGMTVGSSSAGSRGGVEEGAYFIQR